jgi:alpha,alpha-trehalase
MDRREMILGCLSTMASVPLDLSFSGEEERSSNSRSALADVPLPNKEEWLKLDSEIRAWWDSDLISATEQTIRNDESKSLLFLPFPYLRISAATYEAQFPVDTAFMNYALLAHHRLDIVRNQLLNYLFLIERYGFVPNANYKELLTRSQTPFFVIPTFWHYYSATKDVDFLYHAYPLLKREYQQYWNASHHQTPIGLATNRDLGDPDLSAELASEAEVLDWVPVFGGDVRRCVPVGTNAGLVSYARVLALVANEIGRVEEATAFTREADKRTALINKYCWNNEAGLFLEYDYFAGKQLPYISEFAYWTLWWGIASKEQASRLTDNLHLLEKRYGLACTDKEYADPHSASAYELKNSGPYHRLQDLPPLKNAPLEYIGGKNQLMWMYPAGWATTEIIITAGLDAYGYAEASRRISAKFLGLLLEQYKKTGRLWEKYNVVDGSLVLPNARYGNLPYHSFTAAAVVLLGRRVFENQPVKVI